MTKPKKWKTDPYTGADKAITIHTDTPKSQVRVWVDNDDVDPKESAKVAKQIARLPRLLEMEKVIKGMFDDRQLDAYPSSDGSAEYALRELTGWSRKEKP